MDSAFGRHGEFRAEGTGVDADNSLADRRPAMDFAGAFVRRYFACFKLSAIFLAESSMAGALKEICAVHTGHGHIPIPAAVQMRISWPVSCSL
jgi:hypothetical protein